MSNLDRKDPDKRLAGLDKFSRGQRWKGPDVGPSQKETERGSMSSESRIRGGCWQVKEGAERRRCLALACVKVGVDSSSLFGAA